MKREEKGGDAAFEESLRAQIEHWKAGIRDCEQAIIDYKRKIQNASRILGNPVPDFAAKKRAGTRGIILHYLQHRAEPVHPLEIAEALDITPGNVAVTLGRLKKQKRARSKAGMWEDVPLPKGEKNEDKS